MHVTFDRFSLLVDGRRVFLRSGSFHYFRLPSPGLWRDRLLRLKRAGYNAVDLYFWWGYHSPAPGVYDFSGLRDVDYLLDLTEQVGLYVVARPGPYICAEVDGGGHPAWLLNRHDVPLRCRQSGRHADSPEYLRYARQWYEQIVPRFARRPNLILAQIENEYVTEDMEPGYMQTLYNWLRELGVTVPIFHNDIWAAGCWADLVDIYGVDYYPITDFTTDWRTVPDLFLRFTGLEESLRGMLDVTGSHSPLFFPELAGGWFASWESPRVQTIRQMLGPESLEIVTWMAIAQGATLYNHYMAVGGTNWGHVGCPAVRTSYDYGAPVHETGQISARYHVAKIIAHQIAALEPLFAQSDPADDVVASDPAILYRCRKSGESRLAFLCNLTGERRTTTLTFAGTTTPPIALEHARMGVVPLHVPLGDLTLLYATAPLFANIKHGDQRLLVFAGPGDVAWRLPDSLETLATSYSGDTQRELTFRSAGQTVQAIFLPDASRAWLVGEQLIVGPSYMGDEAPSRPPFREVRRDGDSEDRRQDGAQELLLHSDTATPVQIYALRQPGSASLDGQPLAAPTVGRLDFSLPAPPQVALPALGPWRMLAACPKVAPSSDEGEWVAIAPGQPLDMDSLGVTEGFIWYRGEFSGPLAEIGLAIRHHAALYLNGAFVARLDNIAADSAPAESEPAEVETTIVPLPAQLLRPGRNVLAVLVESVGHTKDFNEDARRPRGLLAAEATVPVRWRARGGLAGEAEGYASIACDDAAWSPVADLAQAPASDVAWLRTRFALDLPLDAWAPIGLRLEHLADIVHIYLNGVLVARDWSGCPERVFYLPEGLLDLHGENTLALALWRRGRTFATARVMLETYAVEGVHVLRLIEP
jgi:beta-galactosidase